jgi:dihydroxyacetone kinase-like protein
MITEVGTIKKLVNDPSELATELVEAFADAHPNLVQQTGSRVLARAQAGAPGKVGIATGGGSGHEPAFLGYVGVGMADSVAVGNVFAAPPPDVVLESIVEADHGSGVLLVYGNYSGDVMNCRLAVRKAAAAGIDVRQLFVTDDLASAAKSDADRRRGIAGDVMVLKLCGAAAEAGLDLDGVERVARLANDRTRTIGIALSGAELPGSIRPVFVSGPDDMEVGMGVHGEPGISTERLGTADEVGEMLVEKVLDDLEVTDGARVALLVNGLGATPLAEQYLVHRSVRRALTRAGIEIHASLVGEFVTSLQTAGVSVTVTALDDELQRYFDSPVTTAGWRS